MNETQTENQTAPGESGRHERRELSDRERERLAQFEAYQKSVQDRGALRIMLAAASCDLGATAVFYTEGVHEDLITKTPDVDHLHDLSDVVATKLRLYRQMDRFTQIEQDTERLRLREWLKPRIVRSKTPTPEEMFGK